MTNVLDSLLGGWHAEPVPLVSAGAALLIYSAGARRLAADGRASPSRGQRALLGGGVAIILVALLSPLDELALQLQWIHMLQHVLLLVVAAPMIVLAHPWVTGTAALSPRLRRILDAPSSAMRTLARRVTAATIAVALFVGVLWTWHIPALYDLTLASDVVHDIEHSAFLAVALAFWTAALPSGRLSPELGMIGRAVVVLGGTVGSWMLAVYIGYAPSVLYAYSGHGSLTAAADQQIAAGVMWIPASLPFLVALIAIGARWLDEDARSAAREQPRPAQGEVRTADSVTAGLAGSAGAALLGGG